MNCKETRLLLQLAADGEIDGQQRGALDKHLSMCLMCRRMGSWLDEINQLPNDIPALDLEAMTADVIAEVASELTEEVASNPGTQILRSKPARKSLILGGLRTAVRLSRASSKKKEPTRPRSWIGEALDASSIGLGTMSSALRPVTVGSNYSRNWVGLAGRSIARNLNPFGE